MISRFYYFISVTIFSLITGFLISNTLIYFFISTVIIFIVTVSITIFPYIYYNHLIELRIISKIQKYSPNEIVNIMDARFKFKALVQNRNYNIVKNLVINGYFDSEIAIINSRLDFYQYNYPYVFSYLPFLQIDISKIREVKQRKNIFYLNSPDIINYIKNNFFTLITESGEYKIMIEEDSVDNFIKSLQACRK